MDIRERGREDTLSLFSKLMILFVFAGLLTAAIFYLNKNEPNYKRIAMEALADQFQKSVTNAHWQWQVEGRPSLVIVVTYENTLDHSQQLIEKDRRPVAMSHLGWPRAEPSSEGCGELWDMILNQRLLVEGFRIYPEFYNGVDQTGNALDAFCRYQLSVGPYFDYKIYTGQVGKVMSK